MNTVNEIGLSKFFVAKKKLLLQHFQRSNFVTRFLSTYRTYLPVEKSYSSFYHFIPRTSFSHLNLNKDYYHHAYI